MGLTLCGSLDCYHRNWRSVQESWGCLGVPGPGCPAGKRRLLPHPCRSPQFVLCQSAALAVYHLRSAAQTMSVCPKIRMISTPLQHMDSRLVVLTKPQCSTIHTYKRCCPDTGIADGSFPKTYEAKKCGFYACCGFDRMRCIAKRFGAQWSWQ